MNSLKIGSSRIGDNFPVFIVAEIGGNFCTYEQGRKLINSAISCGANAVKIQTFKAENLVSKYATFNMPSVGGKKRQIDILKKLELSEKIQKKLFRYCKTKKITFFSTPSHISDVDFLEEIGNRIYKIGSDDLTNLPLIEYVAKLQKPTIISTGMGNLDEVKEAVQVFRKTKNQQLAILHCVSMYPHDPKYSNLSVIKKMKNEFELPVGWSDHTLGIETCVAAATIGANIVEKHFTLNKKAKGPDHALSADPYELSRMVQNIRMVEKATGSGIKKPAICELGSRKNVRKSVIALQDIDAGTVITADLLEIKRPGTGFSPNNLKKIIGKKTLRMIKKDKPIKLNYLK